MGACQSTAPTVVEPVTAAPVFTDKNVLEQLAKINARTVEVRASFEAELAKVNAVNKAVDNLMQYRHDHQLRQFALNRGVDMSKFDAALRLRREREAHADNLAKIQAAF